MTNKKESPQKNVETIETFTPKTPDFSHRCEDYPQNHIIQTSCEIETILNFLYGILEPADTLPPPHICTVERLHNDNERLKERVNDAIHIIYNLNRDIKALAKTID
jgi:hypothetical protein